MIKNTKNKITTTNQTKKKKKKNKKQSLSSKSTYFLKQRKRTTFLVNITKKVHNKPSNCKSIKTESKLHELVTKKVKIRKDMKFAILTPMKRLSNFVSKNKHGISVKVSNQIIVNSLTLLLIKMIKKLKNHNQELSNQRMLQTLDPKNKLAFYPSLK